LSDVVGELARARDAFERPTLRLLNSKWSPLCIAIFRSAFSRERRSVQADRLHAQVESYLEELRADGLDVPPSSTGRSLCVSWMRDQWLYRVNGANGEEEYSLTSHALEALDMVQSMSRERALISESRLTMLLDAVRRSALEASPDAGARIERLDVEIAERVAERDRLADGGEVHAASDDKMLDAFLNLRNLISQLPSDFKRVEESVQEMHRQILRDFRDEERPVAQVLDEYLRKQDDLVKSTPEGRAFDGAFVLLRDEALKLELRENLNAILSHPFTEALSPAEHAEFRSAVNVIQRGMDDVLGQRRRLTATLREHIVNHDALRERELDKTLRGIARELATWMEGARPRATVAVRLLPGTVTVGHLRERFYDPKADIPPPPLEAVEQAPVALSLEELRQQGGPTLEGLRDALAAAIAEGDMDSLGDLFNDLPPKLRRPVEILGLVHLLAHDDALRPTSAVEMFEAIRPSGERRNFAVPRMPLPDPEPAGAAPRRDLHVVGEGSR
jgi:hypothetical protein